MRKKEMCQLGKEIHGDTTLTEMSRAIDLVFPVIAEALKRQERIMIRDFGVFETKVDPAHEARNPKTGEMVHVEDRVRPKFRFADKIKKDLIGK